jgi:hypothetical protein
MASSAFSEFQQNLESALRARNTQAATRLFQDMIGLAPDLPAMGREVGHVLLALYDDLEVETFLAFSQWLERHPAEEIAAAALQLVGPQRTGLKEWRKTLSDVEGERLARDLRTLIRSRDIAAASSPLARRSRGSSWPRTRASATFARCSRSAARSGGGDSAAAASAGRRRTRNVSTMSAPRLWP